MSVFGAMLTAVTGLRAQGYALENISGNIANSRTTGYKRVDTEFIDLIPDGELNREHAGSVRAHSQNTVTLQGDMTTSQVGTNMAINGNGMFIVQERSGQQGNQSVFGGANYYTRRGDFELDKDGYLVNGSGYYLTGIRLDASTGALAGSAPEVLRITNDNLAARATTAIEYRANLPSYPRTTAATAAVAGSELLTASGMGSDPTTAGAGTVSGNDASLFLDRTIPAGAVTVYNSVGAPVNVQLRWGKTQNQTGGGDVWNMFYQENSAATGTDVAWRNIGQNFSFSSAGNLVAPTSASLASATINGSVIGPVTLDFGGAGLTQFADAAGQVQVNTISQDGYATGTLDGVRVGDNGRIVASYSNGQIIGMAQVMLADFSGDNFLKRRDGGAFEKTMESGSPTVTQGGRAIVGGVVENSNTDISEEFSKMIVTQQAYSANTRVISTSQEMLRDVMNIIR